MPSIDPYTPTRDELKAAIADLGDDARRALAAAWPAGVPGLKGDHQHTLDERRAIHELLVPLVKADGLAGPDHCQALKARLLALPDDLRDHVNEHGVQEGIPHLDRHDQVTAAHGQTLDLILTEAETTHAERRRRLHAALAAAGLNETDDLRHALIHQLTARVTSSSAVTGDEADWIVNTATRVELGEAGLLYNDQGAPLIVDRDKQPIGPRPVERDWKAWCKDHGVTQKATLEAAVTAAGELGLEVPAKVGDITHPALVAAIYAALGNPEPKTVAPAAARAGSDSGGGEEAQLDTAASAPNPPTLIVVHTRDGIEVIPITNPTLAAEAVASLKAVS